MTTKVITFYWTREGAHLLARQTVRLETPSAFNLGPEMVLRGPLRLPLSLPLAQPFLVEQRITWTSPRRSPLAPWTCSINLMPF